MDVNREAAPGLMPLLFGSRRMSTMPKKIDAEHKARPVRLVHDHQGEYSSLTAAAAVVAKQLGVGKESVRRWVIQSQVDGGQRAGASTEELAEIKALKAKVRRLEEDNAILKSATVFFAGELDPRNR
jgi:transposase